MSDTAPTPPPTPPPTPTAADARRVAVGAFVGTALE